jgi:hypothetical protein
MLQSNMQAQPFISDSVMYELYDTYSFTKWTEWFEQSLNVPICLRNAFVFISEFYVLL